MRVKIRFDYDDRGGMPFWAIADDMPQKGRVTAESSSIGYADAEEKLIRKIKGLNSPEKLIPLPKEVEI